MQGMHHAEGWSPAFSIGRWPWRRRTGLPLAVRAADNARGLQEPAAHPDRRRPSGGETCSKRVGQRAAAACGVRKQAGGAIQPFSSDRATMQGAMSCDACRDGLLWPCAHRCRRAATLAAGGTIDMQSGAMSAFLLERWQLWSFGANGGRAAGRRQVSHRRTQLHLGLCANRGLRESKAAVRLSGVKCI